MTGTNLSLGRLRLRTWDFRLTPVPYEKAHACSLQAHLGLERWSRNVNAVHFSCTVLHTIRVRSVILLWCLNIVIFGNRVSAWIGCNWQI